MAPTIRAAAIAAVAAALAPTAYAQSLTVDNTTIPANTDTVAPAVTDVANSGSLFTSETAQLTSEVLANLTSYNLTSIDMFDFGNETSAAEKRGLLSCKFMPGDLLYPMSFVWDIFGLLLGRGALIKTVPFAAPCYDNWGVEDAATCAFITNNWSNDSFIHADDPTSVMWPLWEGATCMPADDVYTTCDIGAYPAYAVNVSNVAQIQLAVNFARNANLRLLVKNTGHDFIGKSSGAGALSIWTHNMKDIKFHESVTYGNYTGPAIKLGAGVQAFEAYAAAHQNNVTFVGGEGKSVGVAGGYVLGGGHSPMSSLYGMAADQVLSMEVVLPCGKFVTVSETSYPDLFWALRGGGGGVYGVVTSVTSKVYPRVIAAVSTFNFMSAGNVTADLFWEGIAAYMKYLPVFADAGTYSYFDVMQLAPGTFYFAMAPFFAPTFTEAGLEALLAPLMADLAALGIPVNDVAYYGYDNFYDAWNLHFPLETVGITTLKTASRLFPRENFEPATGNATLFEETVAAWRSTITAGGTVLAFNIKADHAGGFPAGQYPDNSVNPAWRNTVLHAIQAVMWDETTNDTSIAEQSLYLTYDLMDQWRATCPDAGAYMSEADILEPNFQQAFYGLDNYARLYTLKQKYDPTGLFYGPTAVGSEDWYITGQVDGLPTQNGRLCRV